MRTLKNLLIYSVLFASASTFAETYYFTNYERNVSGTNNNWNTADAWTNSAGVVTSGARPRADDDAVFDLAYLKFGGRDCVVDNGTVVKNITITNGFAANLAQGSNTTLTIKNSVYKYFGTSATASASTASFTYGGNTTHSFSQAPKVSIGGDVIVGELDENGKATINGGALKFGGNGDISTSWNASLGGVTIAGKVIVRYASSVIFNSAYDYDGVSHATVKDLAWEKLNEGVSTVKIGGALTAVGGQKETEDYWTNPNVVLMNRTTGQGGVAIVEANGITETFNSIATSTTTTTDSIAVLRLVNDATANYQTNTWFYDKRETTTPLADYKGKLMIQMAGVGTQKLAGERFCITGGVDILSGTLQINMSNSTEALTYSRGDITLRGGKFGSMLDGELKKGEANMLFSNFVYTAGTLMLYSTANHIDMLTLTGTLLKGEKFSMGSKMNIEISGDAAWLIDNYAKILAWDNDAKITDFDKSEFQANSIEIDGKIYDAVFDVRNDGLWLGYVAAIPEPATFAAILGTLAVALALRRRK